jgi:putative transposase
MGHSDLRWRSDGLRIKCDSGQTLTSTFANDGCDRELIAWRAWEGKVLPGVRACLCPPDSSCLPGPSRY